MAAAVLAAACGGGGGGSTATPAAPKAPAATATAPASSTPVSPAAAPTVGVPTVTSPLAINPCTLPTSLGEPLRTGPSFALDTSHKWQMCPGEGAAGSGEKYLFRTADGGHSWTLISQTTLRPAPEAGIGTLPNYGGVVQILFLDANTGWMGLDGPDGNLWHSSDGGSNWTEVTGGPPTAVPVTSITFSSANNGTVVTRAGTWTTTDGGATWTMLQQ